MALFTYRATDTEGVAVEGLMPARSDQEVARILEQRALQAKAVERLGDPPSLLRRTPRLARDDLSLFNEQLVAVLESGCPVGPSLRALAQDRRNRRIHRILETLSRDIEAGKSLEEAVGGHADSFPPEYVGLVRAGGRAGNLGDVLAVVNSSFSGIGGVEKARLGIVVYPLLITGGLILILGFLLVAVVPHFANVFREFGGHLPKPTQLSIEASAFVRRHVGLLSFIAISAAILAGWMDLAIARGRSGGYAWDWLIVHMPAFGRFYSRVALARFTRAFSWLLLGKAPSVESLDLAAAAAGNGVLRRAAADAALHVAQGGRLADALAETGYFGQGFCWTVAAAEERGRLGSALAGLAEAYEQDVIRSDALSSMVITAVMLVVFALIVGFVIVSMYLPLFTLGDAISGL